MADRKPPEYYEKRDDLCDSLYNRLEKDQDYVDHVTASRLAEKAKKIASKKVTSAEGYVPPTYISYYLATKMFGKLLQYRPLTDNDKFYLVIGDILDQLDESEQQEWEQGRTERYLKNIAKRVRLDWCEHPAYLQMIKNDTVDNIKLNQCSTFNLQMKTLFKSKKMSDKLDRQADMIEELMISHIVNKASYDAIVEVTNIDVDVLQKHLASKLKQQGFSQKMVSKHLNRSLRTVKRWWNDL